MSSVAVQVKVGSSVEVLHVPDDLLTGDLPEKALGVAAHVVSLAFIRAYREEFGDGTLDT